MNFRELLLLVLAGWTAIGAGGITVSFVKRERAKAMRGLAWIVGVWVAYLGVLIWFSLKQPQRVVAIGQEQCFDEMCFTVTGVDKVAELPLQNGRLLVRVSVRMRNRGHEIESARRMQAYLMDAQGRLWGESPGLSGVRLTTRVEAGESVVSEPVFAVAADASGLRLVFTRGQWQPGILVIGDPDSLLHRLTWVPLGDSSIDR